MALVSPSWLCVALTLLLQAGSGHASRVRSSRLSNANQMFQFDPTTSDPFHGGIQNVPMMPPPPERPGPEELGAPVMGFPLERARPDDQGKRPGRNFTELEREKLRMKKEWLRAQAKAKASSKANTTTPRVLKAWPTARPSTTRRPVPSSHDSNSRVIEALLKKLQEANERHDRPRGTTPPAAPRKASASVATVVTVVCCVCLGVTFLGVAALVAWHKCRARKGAGENSYVVNYGVRPEGINIKVPGGHLNYPHATYRSSNNEGKPPAYPYPDQAPIPALEILQQQQQQQLEEGQAGQRPVPPADHYTQID